MKYPIVTLCGSKSFTNPWVLPCINSWKNISDVDPNGYYLSSDGNLTEKDAQAFRELNFTVFDNSYDVIIDDYLAAYPTLRLMRKKEIMWRKLLDPIIHLRYHERIIILDTDIFVKDKIKLPEVDFDIAYMRDDVPAYVGNWKMVWSEPMVPALNAGFIVVKPALVDLDFLEAITKKYIINNSKDTWLSEQTAWACIAGRLKKRMLLKGNKARVLTGMKKRPLPDIINNRFKYHVGKELIDNFEEFKPLMQSCSLMHFPNAKRFIMPCLSYLDTLGVEEDVCVEGDEEGTVKIIDKIAISLKLFLKEY